MAALVDPAVVDINVTYPGNNGGASGTGMILAPSGLVLTNNHVVKDAVTIAVIMPGESATYTGKVLGVDPDADVALVQMEDAPDNLPTVAISSGPAAVGDHVIAIGNALGKGGMPTVTDGMVKDLGLTITASDFTGGSETLTDMMEMSAPLAPGDSGGPLVTAGGQVVGMDTAASGSGSRSGFSTTAFAIPIENAMGIVQQIRAGEASTKVLLQPTAVMGVLGVAPANWSAVYGRIDTAQTSGAAVEIVESGSPAAAAGIQPGDIITTFEGEPVTSPSQLEVLESGYPIGSTVTVGWVTPLGTDGSASLQLTTGPWS